VRESTLWRRLLGVEKTTIVEQVEYDAGEEIVIARVRRSAKLKPRCGKCGARAPRYDLGEGRRRWRALDLGTIPVWLEADAPRVNCPVHKVTVGQVPWARHGAGHTRFVDDQTAWLATITSKSAATELMRIAWRTVGAIITRVWDDTAEQIDLFAGLTRIGID
jgi:transposase